MEEERNETAPSAFEPLNDVLATYGLFIYPQDQPLVTSKQKSAKHGRLFGAILLCTVVAFVTFIVTGAVKVEAAKSAQKSVGETTACWKEGRPVSKNCEPDETTVELTFFNVTNPHGVLDGDQPRLLDVGPYVLQSKRFRAIVESDQDQSTVSEIFNSFMSFDTDRCPLHAVSLLFLSESLLRVLSRDLWDSFPPPYVVWHLIVKECIRAQDT